MRLFHYTLSPLVKVHSFTRQPIHFKPLGLWVSVEGNHDWPEACANVGHSLHRHFIYEIGPAKGAKVLHIKNAAGIDRLTSLFGRKTRLPEDPNTEYVISLRWPEITARWHGIIIAPYVWERRYTCMSRWYYSWDCASGCIWEPKAIGSIDQQPRSRTK